MKLLSVVFCIFIFTPLGWSRARQEQTQSPAMSGAHANESAKLKSVLLNIYLSGARVHDLLSQIRPESLNMSASDLSAWQQDAQTLHQQLQTLEKWRYDFLYHLESAEDGRNTLESLNHVIPTVQDLSAMIGEHQGGAAAEPLRTAAGELKELKESLVVELASQFPGQFAAQATPKPAPVSPPVSAPGRSEAKAAPANVAPPAAKPAPATVTARTLQPEQVKALMQKAFLATARINDLLSVAQPAKWKMTNAERALLNDRVQTVNLQLKTLEKWRYGLFYHPENAKDAEGTVQSIHTLVPELQGIASAISQYQGASSGAQFSKAVEDLASTAYSLSPYVASLEEEHQQHLAAQAAALRGPKGVMVERITPRTVINPITTPVPVITLPLTPAQVKSILFKIYTSYFRINDLLGQEHPEQWKASPAERTLVSEAREALLVRLQKVEKWRALFSQSPDNVYYGFETYIAVTDVLHPLRIFSREVSRDENAGLGADYRRRAADLESQLRELVPYFGFVLKNNEAGTAQYQADLANCQNKLGYAMHGFVRPAAAMRNVVPDFEGRRARREKDKRSRDRR
ncbi:MAG: hypothetical protein ACRD2B_14255 [Terriglobia bacterium]